MHCQDFLTSAYLLTSKDRFYSRSDIGQLCAYMGDALVDVVLPTPALLAPLELWTGKQVFSMLIRPNPQTRCSPDSNPATSCARPFDPRLGSPMTQMPGRSKATFLLLVLLPTSGMIYTCCGFYMVV